MPQKSCDEEVKTVEYFLHLLRLEGCCVYIGYSPLALTFDFPLSQVKGVALYISDFQRPVTERLQKNFFSDPTQASVACAKVGKIELAADINKGKEGEEVFEQARSLLFKSVRIRRIYDEQARTLIYVSYRYEIHCQTCVKWKPTMGLGFRVQGSGFRVKERKGTRLA